MASRFVAASSCLLALASLEAARRPRYGGVLRIETRAGFDTLDPSATAPDSRSEAARKKILSQVFETLVRLDARGEPQPLLAAAWTHDAAHKRWIFTPRSHVTLHDGTAWEPPGGIIAIDDRRPIGEILLSLADPRNAIAVRTATGALAGTGPFRVARWEPGSLLTLEAHDAYWGGRPYLDQVEIRLRRSERDRSLDFDLGRADVIELPVSEVRRAQQRGGRVAVTSPIEVLALVVDSGPPEIERALSLAIDRNAIYNVLLQRAGVISGALLPYWLGGYSFVFPSSANLARARELTGAQRRTLSFAYDQQDPLLRLIAERIILNVGEAGISLRPAPTGPANVRLVALRFSSTDPAQALGELAAGLGAPAAIPPDADLSQLYSAERELIASRRVIPLFHLPAVHQLSPTVHGWPLRNGTADQWPLDEVWLDERGKP
jgi:peptide/nickel transport system substrate-binding protein